jgi:hypothetical protein
VGGFRPFTGVVSTFRERRANRLAFTRAVSTFRERNSCQPFEPQGATSCMQHLHTHTHTQTHAITHKHMLPLTPCPRSWSCASVAAACAAWTSSATVGNKAVPLREKKKDHTINQRASSCRLKRRGSLIRRPAEKMRLFDDSFPLRTRGSLNDFVVLHLAAEMHNDEGGGERRHPHISRGRQALAQCTRCARPLHRVRAIPGLFASDQC